MATDPSWRAAPRVAVIGNGKPDPVTDGLAEEVGRLLAEAGAVVVCGGLGGVMEAACRGAAAAGGVSIALVPGDDVGLANEWASLPIATSLVGEARNAVVVANAGAVIAIGGEYGTLSEIALAARRGLTVVGIGTWTLAAPHQPPDPIVRVETPADAVAQGVAAAVTSTR